MGGGVKKAPLLKIYHTCPTLMKLGTVLKNQGQGSKKYMNHMTQFLSSVDISIFHRKSAKFFMSRNTDIDCILLYNF